MEPFSPEERASIEAAITEAESKTSGEIIVVVATASAGYFAYALMWAALLALLVPWPLIYLTNWPVEHIYLAQLGVFLLGAAAHAVGGAALRHRAELHQARASPSEGG